MGGRLALHQLAGLASTAAVLHVALSHTAAEL